LRAAREAALGLVRAADRLRGSLRRPDRAPDRARRRQRADRRRVVGGWLGAAPDRRLRRGDARRALRLPALRRRESPRLGKPPQCREAAFPPLAPDDLAEGEGVRLDAGREEDDLEGAVADRSPLAHELVKPRLDQRSVAAFVDVDTVSVAG